MACLVKFIYFAQGIFKGDRFLISVRKMKIEYADLMGAQGLERLVKYGTKLFWPKSTWFPRIHPAYDKYLLKDKRHKAVLRVDGRVLQVKLSQELSCPPVNQTAG